MALPKRSLRLDVCEQALLLEETDEARADGVDACLVVAAAVDVHGLAQQRQHRLFLRGQPVGDLRLLRRLLGHFGRLRSANCRRHSPGVAVARPSRL